MVSDDEKKEKCVTRDRKPRKRFRWLIAVLFIAIPVGVSIAWYSLQPSLSLAFFHDSAKDSFEMTLDGEPFTMPYRIMIPKDAGSVSRYPVVLYLCGSAQCGTDNTLQAVFDTGFLDRLANNDDARNKCIVIAPQIPSESLSTDDEILAGYMALIESVQKKYNADPDRLYLLGFSMGADSIWSLLAKYPDKIAAAVPICGGLGDLDSALKFSEVPIWMFHGRLDLTYPVFKAREMADNLEALGDNIRYTEYAFNGHICWHKAYAEPDLLPWMFAQSKSSGGQPTLASV